MNPLIDWLPLVTVLVSLGLAAKTKAALNKRAKKEPIPVRVRVEQPRR